MQIQLDSLTIAAVDVPGMTHFYNQVFAAELAPFDGGPFPLQVGKIGNLRLVLCPNKYLGIQAEKNRMQFGLTVSDAEALVDAANTAGGQGELHLTPQGAVGTLIDPDGNTIEIRSTKID